LKRCIALELAGVEFIEENDVALAGGLGKPKRRSALEGCDGNLKTARWRHCGRPKAAAFSTSARWSAVGTYSAGISRSVSLN
jgi:hypothetical protein